MNRQPANFQSFWLCMQLRWCILKMHAIYVTAFVFSRVLGKYGDPLRQECKFLDENIQYIQEILSILTGKQ